ncbi:hypothetical protein psyc5s11_30340 [Clostridium gelidum]|uniref:HTH cro/C1-type domain-containing protein n=1 Tax=Clostridium gelidum TaxID=704125 RepID=A0ABM7T6R2_9CLOT|nr:helix-turn-helix transcriptional regulator [Clostridium gelidum]BCZ46967.1 hypothetical protein psyc5s11_30340 [Clostridium gelidum]
MNISKNIKEIRKLKDITQKELAEKINVDVRTIQNYESSRREPNTKAINTIANAIGVPIVALTDDNYFKRQELLQKLKELIDKQGIVGTDINRIINSLLNMEGK